VQFTTLTTYTISTHLGDIVSRIYEQLEQISESPNTIQLSSKSIAILALWAIQFENSNKPLLVDNQSFSTQLWHQIHTANSASGAIYLDALLRSTKVDYSQVTGGLAQERATRAASLHLLHVLSGVDPVSAVVGGVPQQPARISSHYSNFKGLLCYHTINAIQMLSVGKQEGYSIGWTVLKLHPQEHTVFTNTLVQVAHELRESQKKVPRWILRSVLHYLSLKPSPPTSVTVNCLLIIAIDLGCDVSGNRSTTLDQRYVYTKQVWISLT